MVGMGTTLADRCKADLVAGVPIAKEALTGEFLERRQRRYPRRRTKAARADFLLLVHSFSGFQTFGMMKKASALVSPDSGAYCYVEALASHQPADLFLWNLYTGAAFVLSLALPLFLLQLFC